MDANTPLRDSDSLAPTLVVSRNRVSSSPSNGSNGSYDETACQVELVKGSGPCMTSATQCLLRSRLRASTLVLCLGSLAFFIRSLVIDRVEVLDPLLARELVFVDWFQVGQIILLALISYKLCMSCELSLRWLRVAELLVFGTTALFFVATQHVMTLSSGGKINFAVNPVSLWYVLMFTYAIYIPNTWKRAAIVVAFMAVAPVACMLFDRFRHPSIQEFVTYDQIIAVSLMMMIGYVSSIYGTQIIGSLRHEAFRARQLGQYHLRERIGAGGMGEVYLAEHQLLKRPCAIKLIRPDNARDPKMLARFEREVRSTAKLSHWNTVEVFDYGHTDDGTFYYVMEYLPGLSIAELVERHGPLPVERVIYLLEQTCDALREAHTLGMVHRDIKPGNLFAAKRGGVYDVAKLLDFGLVKPLAESALHLTQDGTITGSPLYMSPEQALGEVEPDARSDIYSLGAVAYFMLTGKPPFDSDKPVRVLLAHANEEPTPPSRLRTDLPTDIDQVVLRCLAKRREDRYQSAADLAAALSGCESAGLWNRELAAEWWTQQKQPQPQEAAVATA